MGLLQDDTKDGGRVSYNFFFFSTIRFSRSCSKQRPHIVETEPFGNTFGPKAQRKRPRLDIGSIEELGESSAASAAAAAAETATAESRTCLLVSSRLSLLFCYFFADFYSLEGNGTADLADIYHPTTSTAREPIYAKGTSRRIWGELYKVLDSSDVVIHVLDARDPLGTRCKPVVEYLRKEKAHKHLVYVLNKVDLVPTWVTVSRIHLFFFSVIHFIFPPLVIPDPHSSQGHTLIPTRMDRYESGRPKRFSRLIPRLYALVLSGFFCGGFKPCPFWAW